MKCMPTDYQYRFSVVHQNSLSLFDKSGGVHLHTLFGSKYNNKYLKNKYFYKKNICDIAIISQYRKFKLQPINGCAQFYYPV